MVHFCQPHTNMIQSDNTHIHTRLLTMPNTAAALQMAGIKYWLRISSSGGWSFCSSIKVENIMSNWFLSVNRSDTASSFRKRQWKNSGDIFPPHFTEHTCINLNVPKSNIWDESLCIIAHRSDHFTNKDGWCPPVTWWTRNQPLAVELQQKLRTWMYVHTCTMLPESRGYRGRSCLSQCMRPHLCAED